MNRTTPDNITLPTIAEIEAATEELSLPGKYDKVVRVKKHFIVKYGHSVLLFEAESIKFLTTNSNVPVPKVYAAFVDEETSRTFIIMECVPGDNLEKLLASLTSIEKEIICKLVRDSINEPRKIPHQII
ncbi:hypothetical protein SI65_05423 [Aspergillus cristatus]|uniref:Aminoglycoside phosphotransferase domain-containing protein n=1 Tax=Aspergillus cristatus TaxID=573508 RepID=A0A1E3BEJ2_ASPCR|nr:hypothetical protein SI65_05423 [Aspergillus cristatus]